MSPLLDALVAAAKVGFDAPKCNACYGNGSNFSGHTFTDIPCEWCQRTGLDASDPERLIGRAMGWLETKGVLTSARRDDDWHSDPFKADFSWSWHNELGRVRQTSATEAHDGSLTGLATALLRLVARVGGGK